MDKKWDKDMPAPFGWKDQIGYMFGNFGNDFTFTFASVFLMVFYTKVLGIRSEIVGVMFVAARFLDAFTDITMGRIADRTKTGKDGKFRQWLKRMSAPTALASFLMYQGAFADAPEPVKIVYMFLTYLLWGSICYTAVNIPYGSMASVLSDDAKDRASLSTFRGVASVFTNLIITVAAPLFIYSYDEVGNQIVKGSRFTFMAGIFSVAALVCYFVCYFWTTERVKLKPQQEGQKNSFLSVIKMLVCDRALFGIIAATIFLLAGQMLSQSINQFLFIDYFKNITGVSLMSAATLLPSILLAPFTARLSKKYGKKELGTVGTLLGGFFCLLLFFLRTRSMWVYILLSLLGGFGFGIFNLITWAFITDIIDDMEVRTGQREDGTIYGAYSFARKIGQAAAGGLGGFALSVVGYDELVQIQDTHVVEGIYTAATLIPAVLYILVGLSLWFIYPLSKKRVEENTKNLQQKKR